MWRKLIAGGVVLCFGMRVCADIVVLKDGRRYTGDVVKTADGYTIQTKLGVIRVAEADFAELIVGAAPSTVTPPKVTVPKVVPSTPAPPAVPVTPGSRTGAKSLTLLLEQGKAALAAGDFKAARDAYLDATSIDPRNVTALHGLGASYMYLNDFARASGPMERAMTAGGAPDRALILNMAVLQIGLKNPMRAGKIIRDYLSAHNRELDEPMLNAMGTAMSLASRVARKQTMFQEMLVFYLGYNARLEAEKPGYKRWGIEWLPAVEVDQKQADYAATEKKVGTLATEMEQLDVDIVAADKDYRTKQELQPRGFWSMEHVAAAREHLNKLKADYDAKATEYDQAVVTVTKPAFPLTMSLVPMDQLVPPKVGASIAVAVTTPVPAVPAPAPHPRKLDPEVPVSSTTGSGTPSSASPVTPTPPAPEVPVIQIVRAPVENRRMRITAYAAAFPVGPDLVVTSCAIVKDALEIDVQTLDGEPLKATLVRADETSGLALLKISGRRLTALAMASNFAGGAVTCAGFPTVNLFNPSAESIPGSATAPVADWKVKLSKHPRLPGAPLLANNRVVGVTLANRDSDPAMAPAVTLDELKKFLGGDAPVGPGAAEPTAVMLQVMATRQVGGT